MHEAALCSFFFRLRTLVRWAILFISPIPHISTFGLDNLPGQILNLCWALSEYQEPRMKRSSILHRHFWFNQAVNQDKRREF
jgi:predicted exporter